MEVPFLCAFPESKSWVIDVFESFSHRDHKGLAGKNHLYFSYFFACLCFRLLGTCLSFFRLLPGLLGKKPLAGASSS